MREIKFRYVWQRLQDNHIWIEISSIESIEGRGDKPFILNKDCFTAWKLLSRDLFTGLKDKNGKEIFEGDILRAEIPCVVKWLFSRSMWCSDNGEIQFEMLGNGVYEVIGNIYENPELLTSKES